MERNVDAILTDLFSALQVFDPTNYIENVPQAPPNNNNSNSSPSVRTMTQTRAAQMRANIDVPEAQPAAAPVEKEKQIVGESPPSVTSPPGTHAANEIIPVPVPELQAQGTTEEGEGSSSEEELLRCAICLDDYPERDFLVLGPCVHSFCRNCLSAQAVHAARSGRAPVLCASCSVPLDGPGLLSLLLPEDAELLSTALAMSLAGPVRYCSACGEAVAGQDGVGEFTCPRCHHVNPIGGTGTNDDALAVLAAEKGWVACPGCGNMASKDSSWSCNFTVCFCGVAFCLRCGKRYEQKSDPGAAGAAAETGTPGASSSSGQPPPQPANQHGQPMCECTLYQRD